MAEQDWYTEQEASIWAPITEAADAAATEEDTWPS